MHVVHTGRPGGRPAFSTGRPCGRPGASQACFNASSCSFVFRSLCYLLPSPLSLLSLQIDVYCEWFLQILNTLSTFKVHVSKLINALLFIISPLYFTFMSGGNVYPSAMNCNYKAIFEVKSDPSARRFHIFLFFFL